MTKSSCASSRNLRFEVQGSRFPQGCSIALSAGGWSWFVSAKVSAPSQAEPAFRAVSKESSYWEKGRFVACLNDIILEEQRVLNDCIGNEGNTGSATLWKAQKRHVIPACLSFPTASMRMAVFVDSMDSARKRALPRLINHQEERAPQTASSKRYPMPCSRIRHLHHRLSPHPRTHQSV